MRTFKVSIEGVAPLRMNRFTDEAKDTLKGGRKKKSKEDSIKEAYERAYTNDKGEYIVPMRAIKSCILNGAKKVPLGKGKAKTDSAAVIFVKKDMILKYSDPPIVIENIVRIPPKTGSLAVKYFLTFPKWSGEFEVLITDDRFPEAVLYESIKEAGMYAGLLDGRPDFGRFIMTGFEEITD